MGGRCGIHCGSESLVKTGHRDVGFHRIVLTK